MAGKRCTICSHPQVDEINAMLINNVSHREISTVFNGVGDMSLHRHKRNHLPKALGLAKVAKETAQGDGLFSQVQTLQNKALSLLEQAEGTGDLRTALMAVKEMRSCMELLGRISGELSPEKILIQLEPSINQIIFILRQEVHDPKTLERVSQRLMIEAGKGV